MPCVACVNGHGWHSSTTSEESNETLKWRAWFIPGCPGLISELSRLTLLSTLEPANLTSPTSSACLSGGHQCCGNGSFDPLTLDGACWRAKKQGWTPPSDEWAPGNTGSREGERETESKRAYVKDMELVLKPELHSCASTLQDADEWFN